MSKHIGIVVPTLGLRTKYLIESLTSVRQIESAHICVVVPEHVDRANWLQELCDQVVNDPGNGLAAAINAGIATLPESVHYINWLGDDDLLIGQGYASLANALDKNEKSPLAYGFCRYINGEGHVLFEVRSGPWAGRLMWFGPQLISQPAMLFRREVFEKLGGLDESLRWAFDLDLLLKMSRLGELEMVPETVAAYRWHQEALSVGSRRGSVKEASLVRRSHLPMWLGLASRIWEPLVRILILLAGRIVSRITHQRRRKSGGTT
jgi:GT2 family glycosyltransferase